MLDVSIKNGEMTVSPFVAAPSGLEMHELPAWAQTDEVLAYARYSRAYLCDVYCAHGKSEVERGKVVQRGLNWYYSKRVR